MKQITLIVALMFLCSIGMAQTKKQITPQVFVIPAPIPDSVNFRFAHCYYFIAAATHNSNTKNGMTVSCPDSTGVITIEVDPAVLLEVNPKKFIIKISTK